MQTRNLGTEPFEALARPRGMRRLTSLALTAAFATAALAGCSADDGDDVATDPEASSTPSASETPSPTASPTVGTYPEFEPTDYTYTLVVTCFCPGAGTPIVVTVADDEVVDAVYGADAEGRGDALEGEQAPDPFRLTIDDVIAEANDTEAAQVTVDWPAGQDFPSSVYVDGDEKTADDERGFEVSDVVVG